ncbi:MAG: L,D-transpeptidase [Granulosicoccaceae bacterium]
MTLFRSLVVFFGLLHSAAAHAEPHGSIDASVALDQQTQKVLHAIVDGDWATANSDAKKLNRRFPDYALGKLLYAETLQVAAGLSLKHNSEQRFSLNYISLLLEAQARAAQPSAVAGTFTANSASGNNYTDSNNTTRLPAAVIRTGSTIDHVILIDLKRSYLMLFDTSIDQPRLVKRHYVASGLGGYDKRFEGDLKTPIGVYNIHGFRSDRSLPKLYGSGALMLDYPNSLDKMLGRSGSGIWLHGVPHDQKSRSPRSSEGCVTMANDYLLELHHTVDLQATRVVLSDKIHWITPSLLASKQEQQINLFERYRQAWTDLNISALHVLYNDGAWPLAAEQHGLNANLKRVSQVNQTTPSKARSKHAHTLSKVTSDTLAVIEVPGTNGVVQMSFRHGDKNEIQTTLYWGQLSDGSWQIIQERSLDSGI